MPKRLNFRGGCLTSAFAMWYFCTCHPEDNNKAIWTKNLNILITVLTAIATTFGVTSCMGV